MNPLERWIASRPVIIQQAAKKWPLGTVLHVDGRELHLIGWAETEQADEVSLILSPIDPTVDYEGALREKVYVCSHHIPACQ